MPARRALRFALLPTAAALLLSACAPAAITKTGRESTDLYNIVLVMAAVVFVVVEAVIVWSVVRYRHRPGLGDDGSLPAQIRENRTIEAVWTVLPSVIVLVLFVLSMKVLYDVDHDPPGPPLTVAVTGFQWQWSFAYQGP